VLVLLLLLLLRGRRPLTVKLLLVLLGLLVSLHSHIAVVLASVLSLRQFRWHPHVTPMLADVPVQAGMQGRHRQVCAGVHAVCDAVQVWAGGARIALLGHITVVCCMGFWCCSAVKVLNSLQH
jgi:hypothetical protein